MRDIISEDIIRKALDESIDEFMMEEGFEGFKGLKNRWNEWGNKWNNKKQKWNNKKQEYLKNHPKVQNAVNRTGKAWNGFKNYAAMYMDAKTNGRWNQQYNAHAQGNSRSVGLHYLDGWLQKHYKRLQDIIYGEYYGDRKYFYTKLYGKKETFDHDWKSGSYTITDDYDGSTYSLKLDIYGNPYTINVKNSYGVDIDSAQAIRSPNGNSYEFRFKSGKINDLVIYAGEDDSTPESYIAKYCAPASFVQYTRNTLGDGDFKNVAINYLQGIQNANNKNIETLRRDPNAEINYNYIAKLFTIENFLGWYSKNNKPQSTQQQQQTQSQQQQTQNQGQQQTQNQGQQQTAGRKDPNWRSANDVTIFNTNNR